jgi:hypothetical protein
MRLHEDCLGKAPPRLLRELPLRWLRLLLFVAVSRHHLRSCYHEVFVALTVLAPALVAVALSFFLVVDFVGVDGSMALNCSSVVGAGESNGRTK